MPRPSPKHAHTALLATVGAAVRARRKELGVSQEELALLAELDRAYLGGIERGEHNLTLVSLGRLCEALNVRPSGLLKLAGH